MIVNEHADQVAVVAWARNHAWRWPELDRLFAIPNGAALPKRRGRNGKWYSPQGKKLKAEGLTAGAPDLVLPCAMGGYCGLFLEMKAGNNKPTKEQENWLAYLNESGYLALVCRGHEEAIAVLQRYLLGGYVRGK